MKNRFLILTLLGLLTYGWNIWGYSIYFLDEAKNAGCAAEMLADGEFFVPHFNASYHDKPVLQYIFMMAAYKVFGVNAFAARLFSVLMGVGVVLVAYGFTRKIVNEKVGWYTALILVASLQMGIQFRMAAPDPYLLFCLTLGLFSFYYGYASGRTKFIYLFYVCVGLGFIAKGPIAYALPGLSILIFLLVNRDFSWQRLMELKVIQGGLLSLLVGCPWYIGSGFATHWEWPELFFITHNLSRYTDTFEGHSGFPFDVVVIVIGALLPASVFLPQSFAVAWTERKMTPFTLYALSIFAGVVGFFFFSQTVLPTYPSPCIPFTAVLLAFFIVKAEESGAIGKYRMVLSSVVYLLIAVALPVGAWIALTKVGELQPLNPALAGVFLLATAGGVAGLYFIVKNQVQKMFVAYLASFGLLTVLAFQLVMPAVDGLNPVSPSLEVIESYDRPMAYYRRINPAYVFNLNTTIPKLETPEELDEFIARNGRVLIISAAKEWRDIQRVDLKVVFEGKYLFEPPTSLIIVNE